MGDQGEQPINKFTTEIIAFYAEQEKEVNIDNIAIIKSYDFIDYAYVDIENPDTDDVIIAAVKTLIAIYNGVARKTITTDEQFNEFLRENTDERPLKAFGCIYSPEGEPPIPFSRTSFDDISYEEVKGVYRNLCIPPPPTIEYIYNDTDTIPQKRNGTTYIVGRSFESSCFDKDTAAINGDIEISNLHFYGCTFQAKSTFDDFGCLLSGIDSTVNQVTMKNIVFEDCIINIDDQSPTNLSLLLGSVSGVAIHTYNVKMYITINNTATTDPVKTIHYFGCGETSSCDNIVVDNNNSPTYFDIIDTNNNLAFTNELTINAPVYIKLIKTGEEYYKLIGTEQPIPWTYDDARIKDFKLKYNTVKSATKDIYEILKSDGFESTLETIKDISALTITYKIPLSFRLAAGKKFETELIEGTTCYFKYMNGVDDFIKEEAKTNCSFTISNLKRNADNWYIETTVDVNSGYFKQGTIGSPKLEIFAMIENSETNIRIFELNQQETWKTNISNFDASNVGTGNISGDASNNNASGTGGTTSTSIGFTDMEIIHKLLKTDKSTELSLSAFITKSDNQIKFVSTRNITSGAKELSTLIPNLYVTFNITTELEDKDKTPIPNSVSNYSWSGWNNTFSTQSNGRNTNVQDVIDITESDEGVLKSTHYVTLAPKLPFMYKLKNITTTYTLKYSITINYFDAKPAQAQGRTVASVSTTNRRNMNSDKSGTGVILGLPTGQIITGTLVIGGIGAGAIAYLKKDKINKKLKKYKKSQ